MRTEYSPAPWSHEPLQATQGADIAIVGNGQVIAVIQHDPDIQTAAEDEIDGDNVVWTPEDRANARLIAAAPELLAALRESADALADIINAANNGLPYSATELVKLFADIRCRADAAYEKASGFTIAPPSPAPKAGRKIKF